MPKLNRHAHGYAKWLVALRKAHGNFCWPRVVHVHKEVYLLIAALDFDGVNIKHAPTQW